MFAEHNSRSKIQKLIAWEQRTIRESYPHIAQLQDGIALIHAYNNGIFKNLGSGAMVEGNTILSAAHVTTPGTEFMLYWKHRGNRYSAYVPRTQDYIVEDQAIDTTLIRLPDDYSHALTPLPMARISPSYMNYVFFAGFPLMEVSVRHQALASEVSFHPAQLIPQQFPDKGYCALTFQGTLHEHPGGISGSPMIGESGLLYGITTGGIPTSIDEYLVYSTPMDRIRASEILGPILNQ